MNKNNKDLASKQNTKAKSEESKLKFKDYDDFVEKLVREPMRRMNIIHDCKLSDLPYMMQLLVDKSHHSILLTANDNQDKRFAIEAINKHRLVEFYEAQVMNDEKVGEKEKGVKIKEFVENRLEEIQVAHDILASLSHPNIAYLFESRYLKNTIVYIFEYKTCSSLEFLIENGRGYLNMVNDHNHLTIMTYFSAQMLLVLDYLNRCKVVHANISSKSFIIDHKGYLKLVSLTHLCKQLDTKSENEGIKNQLKGDDGENTESTVTNRNKYFAEQSTSTRKYTHEDDVVCFGKILQELLSMEANLKIKFFDWYIQTFPSVASTSKWHIFQFIEKVVNPDIKERQTARKLLESKVFKDVDLKQILLQNVVLGELLKIDFELLAQEFKRNMNDFNNNLNSQIKNFEEFELKNNYNIDFSKLNKTYK